MMLRGDCLRGLASPHSTPFKWMSPQMQKIRRFCLSARDTSIKMTSRGIYSLPRCCELRQHDRKYSRPLMNAADVQLTEPSDVCGCVNRCGTGEPGGLAAAVERWAHQLCVKKQPRKVVYWLMYARPNIQHSLDKTHLCKYVICNIIEIKWLLANRHVTSQDWSDKWTKSTLTSRRSSVGCPGSISLP